MTKTADVIVIGSGIVGNATAYELAKRGKSVLVLEKYPNVGDGASSRNGAGVRLAGRVSPEAELAAMAMTSGRHWARSWTQIWSMSSAVA
jgi:sarcosine oxidase subunit beta